MDLGNGLVLRTSRPDDLTQIEALLAERGEPADAVDLRLVVHDPDEGFDACAVVVDGERVASTATLLRETVVVSGTAVPAGQVELVATHPAYEGRGLVRALMAWAHERSRARGDLVQVMIGIPFFYRQFGYAYALPIPRWTPLATVPEPDPAIRVRPATAGDIPTMQRLQAVEQASVDVHLPHSAACWRWLVARDGSTQWVAERDGEVVATARATPPSEGMSVGEMAAVDAPAARALVAHLATMDPALRLQERATPTMAAIPGLLGVLEGPEAKAEWYYARVPDLAALLSALAPVLTTRLEAAGLGADRHEVLLSTWRAHVRFAIGPDGMGPVAAGGPEQRPVSKGGAGIPPDGIPALLLGPHGALGLEERLPDCFLGRQRDVMAALFPPLTGDLLTFYLP